MPARNSLAYPRDEVRYYRQEARDDGLLATAAGWAYYGPLLVATLLWWAVTRLIGLPVAGLRAGWRRLSR